MRLRRRLVVEHVALDEVQVRMLVEMRELQRVAVEVVVDDDLVVARSAARTRCEPMKPAPPVMQIRLFRQRHDETVLVDRLTPLAVASGLRTGAGLALPGAGCRRSGNELVAGHADARSGRSATAAAGDRATRRSSGRTATLACSRSRRTGMPRNVALSASSKIATGSRPDSLSDR